MSSNPADSTIHLPSAPNTAADERWRQEEWERLNAHPVIRALNAGSPLEEIFTPTMLASARGASGLLACCDPRIPLEEGGKIALAGSLILATQEEIDAFVHAHGDKLREVSSHDGCSAAVRRFEELEREGALPPGVKDPRDLAIAFARELAARVQAPHRHFDWDELTARLNFARAIWVDATGRFQPHRLPGMPPHFLASAAAFGFPLDYVANEVAVLASIAMGPPGFGARFSAEQPLHVLCAAGDDEALQGLLAALRAALGAEAGRTCIHGLVLPE